jgi:hypothetical protein
MSCRSANGTAAAGTAYPAVSGTLTFAPCGFGLAFGEEGASLGVLGGYCFPFLFSSSLRHLAASSGLPQAS